MHLQKNVYSRRSKSTACKNANSSIFTSGSLREPLDKGPPIIFHLWSSSSSAQPLPSILLRLSTFSDDLGLHPFSPAHCPPIGHGATASSPHLLTANPPPVLRRAPLDAFMVEDVAGTHRHPSENLNTNFNTTPPSPPPTLNRHPVPPPPRTARPAPAPPPITCCRHTSISPLPVRLKNLFGLGHYE
jgi:hypothetical protein